MVIEADFLKGLFIAVRPHPKNSGKTECTVRDGNGGTLSVGAGLDGTDAVQDLLGVFSVKRQDSRCAKVVKVA